MQLTIWTYEGPPHVGAMRVMHCGSAAHHVIDQVADRPFVARNDGGRKDERVARLDRYMPVLAVDHLHESGV